MSARTRRAAVAVVAAATAVTTAWGTAAQAQSSSHSVKNLTPTRLKVSDWKGKVPGLDTAPAGRAAYFVQLRGQGAVDAGKVSGRAVPGKVLSQRAVITGNADRAFASVHSADAKAVKLYTTTNLIPGFAVNTDAAGVKALASRPDVVKVSRIIPKTATNANTANLVHALNTWKFNGDTGKGVRVGVIDTGLDYTHADFGGPGTAASYDDALAHDTAANWRSKLPQLGKDKVLGGFDLAGDDYNADPTSDAYQPIPHPDKNPLDCNEHGTHVAGIAAGYGVTGGGKTFTGNYANLDPDKLLKMRVGPGMAPQAELYSLRVFGCAGSTDLVGEALDRAMDPNQDGDTSDHFDLINLSVGSDDGVVDDPENAIVASLAAHGVLPVISMGNGGDNTDIGGAPGNAPASLAVASSVDSFQMRDGLEVNAPAEVSGISAGQFSVAYDWANNGPTGEPVTGDVVKIPTAGVFDEPSATNNTDGCAPLSDAEKAAVTGKVAWLYWDDNDATRRCGSAGRAGNVAAAGAVGAIFTSSLDVFGAGITGSAVIPVIQLPKAQTDRLAPAVDNGLNVTFDGANQATVKDITPAINDTLSSFSSRGTHGSLGVVKPDVTAPGDTIASAGMGTGNNVLVISGTSMASPLVAGVSALVKSQHPDWSPLMLKAAVMNTATHDVFTEPGHGGHRYAPARVGSGRVDARAAVLTKSVAYAQGANQPVSASFGVVEAPIDEDPFTKSKTIVVRNLGNSKVTYNLSYDAVNPGTGVRYSVSPRTLKVGAHGKGTATLTMRVDPTALTHKIDPTMQAAQSTAFGDITRQFVADSSGHLLVTPEGKKSLRVPVYGAAKPVSETKASADGDQITFTGAGVNQGTSNADAYFSTASIMQLGDDSLQQPQCTATIRSNCWTNQSDRSGDIHNAGAGSGTIFGTDHMVWFGISTWRDWATNNTMTPYVDIDVDGDGRADLETFAQNFASAQGRTDVFLVETVDLVTGDLLDVETANLFSDQIDTNVFDTNTILLPVDLDAVLANGGPDLTGADTPITYTAAMHNGYTGADQDATDPIDYNIGSPDLREASGQGLLDDQNGASYTIEGSGKALVFHMYGESGERDEVVDVTAPPAPPTP